MTFSKLGTDLQTGQIVELPKTSRPQGLYIIGIQGTGKSGLIENLIMQDIKQQIGVCVLDPHGELIEHVIARLPSKAEEEKVVLLDIENYRYPFGLNLFACSDLSNPVEVEKTVDKVMHVFDKLLGVSNDTPLIAQYLLHCTHTLVANPGYTMAEIPLLLTNKNCRHQLVANVKKMQTRLFWDEYFDPMPPPDQRRERIFILRRVEKFLQDVTLPIVGQSTSTINLQKIMDDGMILLVKLDPEMEQVTTLVGSLLIALLLNAAYARPIQKRRQFHLYADEFERFATEDFATLLEQARKFGIATTIAHQNRGQLNSANGQLETDLKDRSRSVGNMVVFKINSKDADDLAGEFNSVPPVAEPVFEHVMESVYDYWDEAEWDSTEAQEEYRTLTEEYARLFLHLEALRYFALADRKKYGTPPSYEPIVIKEERNAYYDYFTVGLDAWNYTYHVLKNMTPASPQWQDLVKAYAWWLRPDYMHSNEVGRYLLQTFYEPKIVKRTHHDDEQLVIRSSIHEGVAYYLPPELPTYFEQHAQHAGIGQAWNGLQPQLFPLLSPNHTIDSKVRNWSEAQEDNRVAGEVLQATRDAFLKEVQAVFWPMKAHAPYYFDAPGYQENCYGFGNGLVDTTGNRYKYEAWRHYNSISGIDEHWKMPLFPEMAWWIRNKIVQFVPQKAEVDRKRTTLWNEHHRIVSKSKFLYYRPKTAMQPHRSWLRADDYVDAPIYRMKEGSTRPIADVRNEIATRLVNLPNYAARVKIATTNGTVEHTIKTLEPEKGLYGKPLLERIDRIRARNIQQGYLRERMKVEAEITKRQTSCSSGSAPAQPQQQQARHARQVPVQGNCPNCGFSKNPSGARFCMQCGTKLI